MIHLTNGSTLHGSYQDNLDVITNEFDFENNTKGHREKIRLEDINSILIIANHSYVSWLIPSYNK